jgi:hypothetical protein
VGLVGCCFVRYARRSDPDRPSSVSPNRRLRMGFRLANNVATCFGAFNEAHFASGWCGHPSGLQHTLSTLHRCCSPVLVDPFHNHRSVSSARLDRGGGLVLTPRGLSPRQKRQASLDALTTRLRIPPRSPKRYVAFGFRSSSCTVKVNRLRAWNAASVARHAFSATPLAVLFSSGPDSKNLRRKRAARSINSNTACWMITSFSNSEIHLLTCSCVSPKRSTGNSALTWHASNSSDYILRWNDLEKLLQTSISLITDLPEP